MWPNALSVHKIKCWSSSDSVLMVIEVAKVVLKVKTDLLMNAVTAATNTHFYVLSLSPLRKCLTFFLIAFPIWLTLNVANYPFLLKFVSFAFSHTLSLFFHLLLPSHFLPAALAYRSIFSHAILFAIFLTVCFPHSHCLPPSRLLSLLSSCWLVDSFYCLLPAGIPSEEHPRCGQAMCGRSCRRGEPDAAVSHKHLLK